ncbi:MAG: T9SS type A sorting domain-containing protein [Bacteroidetes bacterium]|nr:T9SS type A sorting domain-containing protein [Bacteroidota bacterium]
MQLVVKFTALIFLYFATQFANAQQSTYQILDVNNFHLGLFQQGRLALSGNNNIYAEAPAGGGVGPLSAGMLWLTGRNQYGELLGYMSTYYNYGAPGIGPAADSIFTVDQLNIYYDKYYGVWKITADEIEYHRQHWFENKYVMPQSISEWPANGDADLKTAEQLAPFADSNGNKLYEPQLGEYPVIRGDKCLFTMINDYNLLPDDILGVTTKSQTEIHVMLYAYNEAPNSLIGNTIFLNYKIINRSDYNDLTELYIGQFIDFDLGYAFDDFIGCDSALNLFYVYNGDLFDGFDTLNYVNQLPAFGVTSLSHPLLSFMPAFKDFSVIAIPYNTEESFYYLQGIYKDGTHLTYGGNGYGGETITNFYMNSRPDDPLGWNDTNEGNPPTDKRGVGGLGPFQLMRGDTLCIEMAMIFANDLNYIDNTTSVNLLYSFAAQLQAIYAFNNTQPCINSINDTTIKSLYAPDMNSFLLFPNPATEYVNVYAGSMHDEMLEVELFNMAGQKVFAGSYEIVNPYSTFTIPLSNLQTGIYAVVFYYNGYPNTELLMVK